LPVLKSLIMSRGSKTFPEMWRAESEWKLENRVQVRGTGCEGSTRSPQTYPWAFIHKSRMERSSVTTGARLTAASAAGSCATM
jgi:hypothetical protein